MRRHLPVLACFLLCGATTRLGAQTTPVQASAADSAAWATWQSFLPGSWSCAGAFSSGRALAADMKFESALDGRWITYNHADRAPGTFKVIAEWGIQRNTRKLISTMHDNSGYARRFDGVMAGDTLTFTADRTFSPASYDERFRWQREGEKLRMTWELSRAQGTWSMGDYVLCSRS